jgi:hypothetical protein
VCYCAFCYKVVWQARSCLFDGRIGFRSGSNDFLFELKSVSKSVWLYLSAHTPEYKEETYDSRLEDAAKQNKRWW